MRLLLKPLTIFILFILSISNVFATEVTIYLTRHGKTMFNTVHRAQGWSDTPLTQAGIDVAQQLGRGLKGTPFIAVYSSDLGRARQTARVILNAQGDTTNPVIEMPGLRESCFGIYEGDLDPNMWNPAAKHLGYASSDALMAEFSAGKVNISKMIDAIAAVDTINMAENYVTVRDRMKTSLKTIAESAQKQGGGDVLIVSHGVAISALLNEMTDKPIDTPPANASVSKIRYTSDGKFIVESINDMSYVEKGK
ncbi:Alpha-ribazole phosphatase [Pragia fontium]|uniref:histidine phosphatase family protein n=1 Tax=Pragia fontium TaxID=82985 RepID=UPI000DFE4DCA|nr:histidine phosphatase family protein [Pragia fontium]SUB83494.1 Alpha-ribazole phosphatase [Pragia fontium]